MKNDLTNFPYIKKIKDNYGNSWEKGLNANTDTDTVLYPGDLLTFSVEAICPENTNIMYRILGETYWQNDSLNQLLIEEKHISPKTVFTVLIKSGQLYHKNEKMDDAVQFSYQIMSQK